MDATGTVKSYSLIIDKRRASPVTDDVTVSRDFASQPDNLGRNSFGNV